MKEIVADLLAQALANVAREMHVSDYREPVVEKTRDANNGDWASNVAMTNAKAFAQKPRDLAEALVARLPASQAIRNVAIAGPGFINFFVNPDWLATELNTVLNDAHLGIRHAEPVQRVVVDYSSPNLAKEMHVGHLRSTIIGDAVARCLDFLGHRVTRQNHVGDWGTQFGMLLAFMERQTANKNDAGLQLADLEVFYRNAKRAFDDDAAFAERARELVVQLQSGDAYCNRLWREFNAISLAHCREVYERLHVTLSDTDIRGESFYNDQLPEVVQALREKQLLREDQGARCVFLERDDGDPQAVIVQKKDGGYLYATTDLAAIRFRCQTLQANRILYFVDQRQALHFEQMFAIARLAGFADQQTMQHMGFGTMNNADGKPFKTREGGTVKLIDLLDEAEERAWQLLQERGSELSAADQRKVARTIGIGSVKYADLSKNRTSDYVFNLDLMLSFEGNTAPYLLYAYTRIASVFRKAGIDMDQLTGEVRIEHEAEQALASRLLRFGERIETVCEKGMPHFLCQYLFELAGEFSSFYEACPIMKAEDATRQSRLLLAKATAKTLHTGLGLLGIETLERM